MTENLTQLARDILASNPHADTHKLCSLYLEETNQFDTALTRGRARSAFDRARRCQTPKQRGGARQGAGRKKGESWKIKA